MAKAAKAMHMMLPAATASRIVCPEMVLSTLPSSVLVSRVTVLIFAFSSPTTVGAEVGAVGAEVSAVGAELGAVVGLQSVMTQR
jgi:hypothetical protein